MKKIYSLLLVPVVPMVALTTFSCSQTNDSGVNSNWKNITRDNNYIYINNQLNIKFTSYDSLLLINDNFQKTTQIIGSLYKMNLKQININFTDLKTNNFFMPTKIFLNYIREKNNSDLTNFMDFSIYWSGGEYKDTLVTNWNKEDINLTFKFYEYATLPGTLLFNVSLFNKNFNFNNYIDYYRGSSNGFTNETLQQEIINNKLTQDDLLYEFNANSIDITINFDFKIGFKEQNQSMSVLDFSNKYNLGLQSIPVKK